VEVLQPRLATVIRPAVVVGVIADQHRDLLEAIARGDPDAAERAMREHLVYLRDVVSAVRQPSDAGDRPDDREPYGAEPEATLE
jgi:DNA-binding GntR family transcriptional regulator